jgi:hypothetical protein
MDEEVGVEVGQGLAELIDFRSGSMDFETEQFGNAEGFLDAGTDVFEVTEDAGRTGIGFTAEDDVVTDREIVIITGLLGAGAGHKFLHCFLEGIEFALLDFEVGVKADGL